MIAVLGCGPAGLLAAHAITQSGRQCVVFSKKQKSVMYGAQYLHHGIPGITSVDHADFYIGIEKYGTREGYALNVYGDEQHPVSWDQFNRGFVPAWDLSSAYDALWDEYENLIIDAYVDKVLLRTLLGGCEIVYNSTPAPRICMSTAHEFVGQEIVVVHGQGAPSDQAWMTYCGLPTRKWYRSSRIRGYYSWEYSLRKFDGLDRDQAMRGDTVSRGTKPISNTCTCWPSMRRIGRFGRWEKGVLTHHAYEQVVADMQQIDTKALDALL